MTPPPPPLSCCTGNRPLADPEDLVHYSNHPKKYTDISFVGVFTMVIGAIFARVMVSDVVADEVDVTITRLMKAEHRFAKSFESAQNFVLASIANALVRKMISPDKFVVKEHGIVLTEDDTDFCAGIKFEGDRHDKYDLQVFLANVVRNCAKSNPEGERRFLELYLQERHGVALKEDDSTQKKTFDYNRVCETFEGIVWAEVSLMCQLLQKTAQDILRNSKEDTQPVLTEKTVLGCELSSLCTCNWKEKAKKQDGVQKTHGGCECSIIMRAAKALLHPEKSKMWEDFIEQHFQAHQIKFAGDLPVACLKMLKARTPSTAAEVLPDETVQLLSQLDRSAQLQTLEKHAQELEDGKKQESTEPTAAQRTFLKAIIQVLQANK